MKTVSPIALLVLALAAGACSSCGSGGNGADDDTGPDTGIDTDWDSGPLTPCEGEAPEGMVCVPGGTYLMGCMPYDTQCDPSELPMVEVTLSPFFVDIAEATYEDIIPFLNTLHDGYIREPRAVMKEVDGGTETIWRGGYTSGTPPVKLSDAGVYEWFEYGDAFACQDREVDDAAGGFGWLGAKEYCEWRGKRLPTEAEWEAAARGQTRWIYPCTWVYLSCWYGYYDNCDPEGECYLWPTLFEDCCLPLGNDQAGDDCTSPVGAQGMYGNAFEWVLDRRDPGPGDNHSWCVEGCTDPAPREGDEVVAKGGSVDGPVYYTRISARISSSYKDGSTSTGVRCVLSPVTFDDEPDGGPDGGK